MRSNPQRHGYDRKGGIRMTAGWKHGGARYVDIGEIENSTIRVYDPVRAGGGHSGGSDMMAADRRSLTEPLQ